MINPREADYWNTVAKKCVDNETLKIKSFNWTKNREQLKKLLEFEMFGTSILEIGIGQATIAQCLLTIYHGGINYQATDVSPIYCDFVNKKYHIPVKQAEVTHLPYEDKSFEWVFAFDSLEHVRPEERLAGYAEIDRVMKNDSCMILHIPLNASAHNTEFDHGFTYLDFIELLRVTKSKLAQFNVYIIKYPGVATREYAWAIGERHL